MIDHSPVPIASSSDSSLHGIHIHHDVLRKFGLTTKILRSAIQDTNLILDQIDEKLMQSVGVRLVSLIELANLSAIIGNLFRVGISKASNGVFKANRPHAYPDLVATQEGIDDIEIKVALETNKPKGHLPKPGPHIIVRYILGDTRGMLDSGKRGDVVWIWEVRIGTLRHEHFNSSNTAGDSGKTAVTNAAGMNALVPVFLDLDNCPYSPSGRIYGELDRLARLRDSRDGFYRKLA